MERQGNLFDAQRLENRAIQSKTLYHKIKFNQGKNKSFRLWRLEAGISLFRGGRTSSGISGLFAVRCRRAAEGLKAAASQRHPPASPRWFRPRMGHAAQDQEMSLREFQCAARRLFAMRIGFLFDRRPKSADCLLISSVGPLGVHQLELVLIMTYKYIIDLTGQRKATFRTFHKRLPFK